MHREKNLDTRETKMLSVISLLCNLLPKMQCLDDQVIIFTYLLDLIVQEEDVPDYLKLILKQKLNEFGPYMQNPEEYDVFFTG